MVATTRPFLPDSSLRLLLCLTVVSLVLLAPSLAHAAATGGGMPWNQWLNTMITALIATGAALIVLGLFTLGAMLIFSHDWGRLANGLVLVIIAGGLLTAGGLVIGNLGITGAVI